MCCSFLMCICKKKNSATCILKEQAGEEKVDLDTAERHVQHFLISCLNMFVIEQLLPWLNAFLSLCAVSVGLF